MMPDGDFTYHNTKGDQYTNSHHNILLHVVNHSTDHRAQILAMMHFMGAQTVEHRAGSVLLRGIRLAGPDPEALADRLRVILDEGVEYQVEKGERDEPSAVVLSIAGEERDLP